MELNANGKRPLPNSPMPKRMKTNHEQHEQTEDPEISELPESPWTGAISYTAMPTRSQQYRWIQCEKGTDFDRLAAKEFAVEQAQTSCKNLLDTLHPALRGIKTGSSDAMVMGADIIKQWTIEHKAILNRQRNFKVLVGVEGPTGAGKSSFLGSLLRVQELLPSGQESAATAVAAKVSWNYDNIPGHEYRAEIILRKRSELEKGLKLLLTEMRRLKEITNSKYDDEDARCQDLAVAKSHIDHELPKIAAVWDLKDKDLEQIAQKCDTVEKMQAEVGKIITSNKAVLGLIKEGVRRIYSSNERKFADEIKPFLDSTKTNLAKDQRYKQVKTKSFKPWPLVNTVNIFVKADILKTGIHLVDLPGCGDAVDSRSEVARKFRESLDVRMIVTPICRATDEKEGRSLMRNGYEEVQMRLNGKLNPRGICVVLSKTDDIDLMPYIQGSPDLKDDAEVMAKVDRYKAIPLEQRGAKKERKLLGRDIPRLHQLVDETTSEYELAVQTTETQPIPEGMAKDVWKRIKELQQAKVNAEESHFQATSAYRGLHAKSKALTIEFNRLEYSLRHIAIKARNVNVRQRLHEDFSGRVIRREREDSTDLDDECWLPVLPISAKAFWAIKNEAPMIPGFPQEIYTGIPAVEQWLHRATIEHREKHLTEVLTSYQVLMEKLRCYSQSKSAGLSSMFIKSDVEAVLEGTHDKFHAEFREMFDDWADRIQSIDPLSNRNEAVQNLCAQAERIVARWSYKYPKLFENSDKMHWVTFQAILLRDGSQFVSKGQMKQTYTWLEDLATPLLDKIADDWDERLNQYLPSLKKPMMEQFVGLWKQYLEQLIATVFRNMHQLAPAFTGLAPILHNLRNVVGNNIEMTLDNLSDEAAKTHPKVIKYLEKELSPTFARALSIRGTGSFVRRQELIRDEVKKGIKRMCRNVMTGLHRKLTKKKGAIPGKLEDIASLAVESAKKQVAYLLNNLLENDEEGSAVQEKKQVLHTKLREILVEWEDRWCEGEEMSDHILSQDHSIPEHMDENVIEDDDDDDFEMLDLTPSRRG